MPRSSARLSTKKSLQSHDDFSASAVVGSCFSASLSPSLSPPSTEPIFLWRGDFRRRKQQEECLAVLKNRRLTLELHVENASTELVVRDVLLVLSHPDPSPALSEAECSSATTNGTTSSITDENRVNQESRTTGNKRRRSSRVLSDMSSPAGTHRPTTTTTTTTTT
eukprot:CAMPEP_0174241466 /NCGR_PEP_ID=MMETSP0417-20130205/23514_1 /TAXON_ID=242541 /ORGANISM="Mayorella sp, Strain BSH-02190019" /LENGTH=165 /DNA_ID=CAMNT_0015320707 /DNA_START=168 /DNA_END=661 /DNA_ORIENTATION=+